MCHFHCNEREDEGEDEDSAGGQCVVIVLWTIRHSFPNLENVGQKSHH